MDTVSFEEVMPIKGTRMDLPGLILSAMRWVEIQCQNKDIHGEAKLELFKANIGKILEFASQNGFVDLDQRERLQGFLDRSFDLVEQMVTIYAAITKNPTVIQLAEDAQAGCSALCRKRERK